MQNGTIACTLTIEELSPNGGIFKQTTHKNVTLRLGRDEFSEIQLHIEFPKKVCEEMLDASFLVFCLGVATFFMITVSTHEKQRHFLGKDNPWHNWSDLSSIADFVKTEMLLKVCVCV